LSMFLRDIGVARVWLLLLGRSTRKAMNIDPTVCPQIFLK
jgi:hypothetical protein